MPRPPLTPHLLAADFASYYWLKEELSTFCRQNGLPAGGSKQDLAARILLFLQTGKPPAAPVKKQARQAKMPLTFTRQSIIGAGWHCSQELRAFFEGEIGKNFHFDGLMRDLIKQGAGKTLEEVITTWQTNHQQPRQPAEIAPQFEYNRHFREYFQQHPGASREEAIQAWNALKTARRENLEP